MCQQLGDTFIDITESTILCPDISNHLTNIICDGVIEEHYPPDCYGSVFHNFPDEWILELGNTSRPLSACGLVVLLRFGFMIRCIVCEMATEKASSLSSLKVDNPLLMLACIVVRSL